MTYIEKLKFKILKGNLCTREEALYLYNQPFDDLCASANEIRIHFCSNQFDLCTIINGKSGRCSEDCKFCSQSSHNHACVSEYPLLSVEKMIEDAQLNYNQGVLRYSIVTSGKRLSEPEIDEMCNAVKQIREQVGIFVCASFGLLKEAQYKKLKNSGVTRIHNNLETSQRNFSNICTTHTFDEKITAIMAAQSAGLTVCSGGIMGLGETWEDRIDMALTLQKLGIKSVPINMLNPIAGTPFEKNNKLTNEDMCRIVAVYRFILPTSSIRLAGGRGLLADYGTACFLSGANATISGNMLTTAGITVEDDRKLLNKLGFKVVMCNE